MTLLSWRLIFFINLPVGVVALYLLSRLPRSPRRVVPFDWAGQVAAVVGMGALTYGAIEAGAAGFGAPRVLVALAVAVVALAAFLVIEARGAHPMMPLGLFRARTVTASASIGFAFTVGFYGLVFLFSLYLQEVRGLSPLATGLAFMPMTALSIVLNRLPPGLPNGSARACRSPPGRSSWWSACSACAPPRPAHRYRCCPFLRSRSGSVRPWRSRP
jgi:DHA2 family methylenomycin A resistance protein-like MFS transporter